MSYQVFARKYRPQNFDSVVGQEHITTTLKNAIQQNRLAHAYLFVGPRGTGKTSTARIFAKALNCENGPTVEPCGKCVSCVEIAEGRSMDVLEFDAASNTQVEKVRELIIENVKYAPSRGRRKLYIVDEVHMLSNSSFNALLKTLEEPPAHVIFLFATTEANKVPLTILSRCQRFDMRRIPAPLIATQLLQIAANEGVQLTPEAAQAVAKGAEGGMRDAESMLDQLVAFCGQKIDAEDVLSIFGFTATETVFELCGYILAQDSANALAVVKEQAEAGKDLSQLMSDLIAHCRNLLVAKADPTGLQDELGTEMLGRLEEQARPVALERLLELVEQFAASENRMRWAPNKKLHFEIAVIKAIQTLGQATLTDVLDTLSALGSGAPVPARVSTAAKPEAPAPVTRKPRPAPTVRAPEAFTPVPVADAAFPASPARQEAVQSPVHNDGPPWEESNVPTPPAPPALEPVVLQTQPVEPMAPPPVEMFETERDPETLITPDEPELKQDSDAPSGASVVGNVPEPAELSAKALWPKFVTEIRKRRRLIASWLETGMLTTVTPGKAVIGFPPDQVFAMESLNKPDQRKFLDEVLSELIGTPTVVTLQIQEGLVSEPVEAVAKAPEPDLAVEFENDPLIGKALELFRAEIQRN